MAKVNAAGTALVYCGYIGGSDDDVGYGIAVDGSGNAYVTGRTLSTEASFPVTVGPDLTHNGGGGTPSWRRSTPRAPRSSTAATSAASDDDVGYGIAVDGSGNAYVTGYTASTEATFPVTVGPDLTYNGGLYDAFVAKVNAAGTALVYCGYIGGSDDDEGYGIAVDGSGNAYVTGDTASTEATFPVTVGPDLTYNGGFADAFVAKVNAAGTALVYCGYIGGGGGEYGYGIAVDSAGNAYVTGATTSTEATFPVTVGPDLTYNGGVRRLRGEGQRRRHRARLLRLHRRQQRRCRLPASRWTVRATPMSREPPPPPQATFPVTVGPDLTYNGGGGRLRGEGQRRGHRARLLRLHRRQRRRSGLRHRGGRLGQRLCHGTHRLHRGHLPRDGRAGSDLQRRLDDAFVAKITAPPSGGTSTPTPTPSNTPTRTPTNTPTRTRRTRRPGR